MKFTILYKMNKKIFSISMDPEAVEALDKVVKKGRFGSRSQAIEHCVKEVLEIEKKGERYIDFLIEFMELIAAHPDLEKELKAFLMKSKALNLEE